MYVCTYFVFERYNFCKVIPVFMNDFHWSVEATVWSEAMVEEQRKQFRRGKLGGGYGIKTVEEVARHMRDHMADVIPGANPTNFEFTTTAPAL
jgi:hypothetical protein